MSDVDPIAEELYTQCFLMPQAQSLVGRRTTINNAFANAILPKIAPTPAEIREALAILGMTPHTIRCAYCGDPYSEWDHLRPIVKKGRPTGYISEIGNLVPACGKCNQSKGNKDWHVWIVSKAKRSPAVRGVADLDARIERLHGFEAWRVVEPLELEAIVGKSRWDAYWQRWQQMMESLTEGQKLADELRTLVEQHRQRTDGS